MLDAARKFLDIYAKPLITYEAGAILYSVIPDLHDSQLIIDDTYDILEWRRVSSRQLNYDDLTSSTILFDDPRQNLMDLINDDGEGALAYQENETARPIIRFADDVLGTNMNDTSGKYIGVITTKKPVEELSPDDFTWVLIEGPQGLEGPPGQQGPPGRDGLDGIAGKDGVGIASTDITYYVSTSGITTPTTGWSSSVPTLIKGRYLWTRTIWTYTDGQRETGYQVTYIAQDGNSGVDGLPGKDGVGISSTSITYARSTSGTTAPTSGWTSAVPTVPAGEFLWTKTIWTYSDNTTETGYSVAKMGDDGRTSYIHWAYSDNADGTGLTFSDNGQRYIGQYSDYTKANSTDKTKYTWADRWAKIEVGGENLVDRTGEPFVMGFGITNTTWNPETKRSRLTFGTGVERAKQSEILPQGGIFESQNVVVKKNQTYTQAIRVATDATFLGIGNLQFTWFGPEVVSYISDHRFYPASIRKIGVNEYLIWSTVTWDRPDIKLRPFDIINLHTALDFRNTGTFLEFYEPKLELGTVPTAHSISENDRQRQLDSKADQALTQEQLNMLIEKAQLMQTELEAKVAMETLSDLERAYKAYVEANDKAAAKSEADLIETGRRVDAMVETLGGLSKTKKFIDTYIKEANEGIIIGTNDNVSQIRVTHDRIAMYSAGKEVMYISQGVIHIDNGIFTKSLQVGRFRTEQHQTNLDINVCRYVG